MQNLINQTIASIPVIFLALAVLVLAISMRKFRVTGFFLVGSVMSLVSISCHLVFWAVVPSAQEYASFMLLSNIIFSAQSVLFLYGVLQWMLEKQGRVKVQQNVLLLIFLTTITLGAYVPYWYIRTQTKYQISSGVIILFVLLFMPSFVMHLYQYSDPSSYRLIASLITDLVLGIIGVLLAFNLRSQMLGSNDELKIDPILTFFFGIFYLQYKINELGKIEAELRSSSV